VSGVLDSFRLDGRVACITGTTRGIGQMAAVALAEAGCDIVHLDRSDPAETRARIEALGRRSALVELDLEHADGDACERAIHSAAAAFGRLDVLVNSAGVVARGTALEVRPDEAERVLHVNLQCVFALSRAAGRGFVEQGSGVIVNVASVLAFQGGVLVSAYATAKHGVVGMTRAFANEWAPHGVRVNALAPGYIATDLNARLRTDTERYEEILARIPAGRWGSPEDLAGAFVYLSSPASRYVTGTVLTVDGGWMSR
jgi:2-dehydro-3-deoxy-D-gluconate 5-dehydrogenase